MIRYFLIYFLLLGSVVSAQSQAYSSAEMYDDLLRLRNYATVMYVAAHPDDENTRLISWLTHTHHLNTVYLSLTRGDGGQNLIGTESGKMLGVLRTQELLEARKIDKGKQWFTRAYDFGYSKSAVESLQIWNEQEVLRDVVFAIRKFQPEIIITRFDPDSEGETHGHHTASAQLAVRAFELASNAAVFPDQLRELSPWQAKAIYFNTGRYFYASDEALQNDTRLVSVEVGNYYPHLGISNNEMAAIARSKHACQGFGAELRRGSETEYFRLLKGQAAKGDIFANMGQNWPVEQINVLLAQAINNFNFRNPHHTAKDLLQVYDLAQAAEVRADKLEDLQALILRMLGIYTEWVTAQPTAVSGEVVSTVLEVSNRGGVEVSFSAPETGFERLTPNTSKKIPMEYKLGNVEASTPYWLQKPMVSQGLFANHAQVPVGKPEAPEKIVQKLQISVDNTRLVIDIPLQYKRIDPAYGERYEPFYTTPAVTARFVNTVNMFAEAREGVLEVELLAWRNKVQGQVELQGVEGWEVSPRQAFILRNKGDRQNLKFKVQPPAGEDGGTLSAVVFSPDFLHNLQVTEIDYEHIPKQLIFHENQIIVQQLQGEIPNRKILYFMGAGDEIPPLLRQLGMDVTVVEGAAAASVRLEGFQTIVLGIRSLNTNPHLVNRMEAIHAFAKNGGTVIMQYQTTASLPQIDLAPLHLKIGRDRISQETAPLNILQPEHPVMNYPNRITSKDFEHWVQERGLYFASSWAPEFLPILSGSDAGETTKHGMLLIAPVERGYFVYTGLSFFRQLPAAVPGAYKLFINLLNLESPYARTVLE
ncbi:MAG: PIG-L family deacetylase [Weeksellaceae bacterium]|nr:PIG-L family deacetylase [Weeksellaceae bacterium]